MFLQPCGEVHRIAEQAIAGGEDVAHVDRHSQGEGTLTVGCARSRRHMRCSSPFDGVQRRVEFHYDAVAAKVADAAAAALGLRLQRIEIERRPSGGSAHLVSRHKSRIANDVGKHDRARVPAIGDVPRA